MVQISRKDKEKVLEAIRLGKIDTAELALPALADSIVLTMKQHGFIEPLNKVFEDKRSDNLHIPLNILLTLAITAKLKQKTSLTAWDYGCDANDGLFSENVMRRLVKKYSSEEMVSFYNNYVQDYVLKKIGIKTRKAPIGFLPTNALPIHNTINLLIPYAVLIQ